MKSNPKYLIVRTNRDGTPSMEIVSIRRTDKSIEQYITSSDYEVYEVGKQISKNGKRI